jgi:hypothetical protein
MRRPLNRVHDFSGAIGDRIVVDGGNAARRLGGAVKWPFQRLAWAFQDRVIWPLQDRRPNPQSTRRAIGVGGAVAAVAGAVVVAVLLVGSNGSDGSAATLASSSAPTVKIAQPEHEPAAPTLQGATPDFKAAAKDGSSAGGSSEPAEPTPTESGPAAASSSSSSAATDKISSAPTAEASGAASSPAGPAAIAVAHRFANAFVAYETGGIEAPVRDAFGETATPELSRALLRRPPRLPSGVDVPEAKVLNVVPGPSRDQVYPVSVSLVRLGVTSELRLSMERDKNDEWRVSDVLG